MDALAKSKAPRPSAVTSGLSCTDAAPRDSHVTLGGHCQSATSCMSMMFMDGANDAKYLSAENKVWRHKRVPKPKAQDATQWRGRKAKSSASWVVKAGRDVPFFRENATAAPTSLTLFLEAASGPGSQRRLCQGLQCLGGRAVLLIR